MSKLEEASKPIIGPMMFDKSMFLDAVQQWTLAAWAVKASMVLEAAVRNKRFTYYSNREREQMRESWTIPAGTTVWLARYFGVGLGATAGSTIGYYARRPGTNIHGHPLRNATIVMGSFVVQVLSGRAPDGHARILINPAEGPWNHGLVTVWPTSRSAYWPPVVAFDDSETMLNIRRFTSRWDLGKDNPL